MSDTIATRLPAPSGSMGRAICREFRGEAGQVAHVRDFVRRRLEGRGCPEDAVDEIAVCVSEVATNALRHTRSGGPDGRFLVTVHLDEHAVRVEVADGGPTGEPVANIEDEDEFGDRGRGLVVVSALADRVDYEVTRWGGLAWFEYRWGVA